MNVSSTSLLGPRLRRESLEIIWVFAADFQARIHVELAFLSAVINHRQWRPSETKAFLL